MKTIQLTKGYEALVDDADYEFMMQWEWTALEDRKTVYAYRRIGPVNKRVAILMHRVILNAPVGKLTDHVDRNGLNNQRYNLRLCTHAQNAANHSMRIDSTSGMRGIYPARNKWIVRILNYHVGTFETLEGARAARKLAEIAVFGEFAPV